MHRRPWNGGLLLLASLLLTPQVGCEIDPDPTIAHTQRPIYNGEPDTASAHAAVVALVEDVGGGVWESFCTGTLIAPDVVLTAAHCVDDIGPQEFDVFFGQDVMAGGNRRSVVDFLQHDGWDPDNFDSPDDIALVFLASDAPASVTPIPPLPASLGLTADDVGMDLTISGYGETESLTYDERLVVTVPLGRVCAGPLSCPWSGEIIVPRAIAYNQTDGGPCSGDSGGPALVLRSGVEYVAGVTAYGDECWGDGVSTLVDAYEDWIRDNAGLATAEDCTAPGDEDGDGRINCDDPDCADHDLCSEGGCRQTGSGEGAALVPLLLLFLGLRRRRATR